jgi:hypothetical protein
VGFPLSIFIVTLPDRCNGLLGGTAGMRDVQCSSTKCDEKHQRETCNAYRRRKYYRSWGVSFQIEDYKGIPQPTEQKEPNAFLMRL